jgi:hypothetical protein
MKLDKQITDLELDKCHHLINGFAVILSHPAVMLQLPEVRDDVVLCFAVDDMLAVFKWMQWFNDSLKESNDATRRFLDGAES